MFDSENKYREQISNNSGKGDVIGSESISCTDSNILSCPKILTGLSHEVRTYMNSIVAFSFLQNSDNCNINDRQEYTDHILNSCDQLITLFDNFLDSALIDAEKPSSNLKKRELTDILQHLAIELNSSLAKFDKSNVSLVLEEQTYRDEVFIDEEKIFRVIKNLFHNAVEHTTSGYIKLGYKKVDSQVVFYVIDSGNGYHLNKELLEADNLTSYLVKNNSTFTTVGLILANKLIESMNGKFWIEPNGVNGTGMYFSIHYRKAFDPQENEDINKFKSRIAI